MSKNLEKELEGFKSEILEIDENLKKIEINLKNFLRLSSNFDIISFKSKKKIKETRKINSDFIDYE
jgi:hypothetical protein